MGDNHPDTLRFVSTDVDEDTFLKLQALARKSGKCATPHCRQCETCTAVQAELAEILS